MGKIFKLKGNYTQYEEWATPDPSFIGEIVVDDNGGFCGTCVELCERVRPDENKLRFIYGHFGKNKKTGKEALVFYKLSSYKEQGPLLYTIIDLDDQSGNVWETLSTSLATCSFSPQGEAKVSFEELKYDNQTAGMIRARFNERATRGFNWQMLHLFDKFAKERIDY